MPTRAVLSKHMGAVVGLTLALLALGPALVHRGYLLVGDMVFLPRPPLSAAQLGLSAAVPRAVPSDLVATLAERALPGDVAEKVLLVAVFVLAASGGARLLADCPWTARVPAAALLAWNPYVAERLALGQWAVLLGYAALPWVLDAAARIRGGDRSAWPIMILAVALAALTPTGGLVASAAAFLVLVVGPRPHRVAGLALVPVAAILNCPWWVPALLRTVPLPGAQVGISAFAARADTTLGIAGSVATLGGIWNADAVTPGRAAAGLAPVSVLVLAGVLVGIVLLLRGGVPHWSRGAACGLLTAAAGATLVAVAGATPGLREVFLEVTHRVPGAALIRDGPRHLGPLAVLEAMAFGLGADALGRQLPAMRRLFAAFVAVVPVLLLPGMSWGISGLLVPVQYPPAWAQARKLVAADPVPGALLALPWSAYRAPRWNAGRTVLDPAVKAFGRRVIADDRLRVGHLVVPGEDPVAARLTGLATGTMPLTAAASAAGIRWVLVERDSAQARLVDLRLSGAELVVNTPSLALWRLPHPAAIHEAQPGAAPVLLADGAATLLMLAAGAARLRSAGPH